MKERWRKWENNEGCKSLYFEKSDGWDDIERFVWRDDVKFDEVAFGLKTEKSEHFIETQFI